MGAARDFLTVHPQADFTVDGAHVVVIPFANALAQVLAWEAAVTIGSNGGKWRHLGFAHGEDIAVGCEPIGFLAGGFLILLGVAVVEHLHFNAAGRKLAGFEIR